MFKFGTVVYVALIALGLPYSAFAQTRPAHPIQSLFPQQSDCSKFAEDMKTDAGRRSVEQAARGMFGNHLSPQTAMDKYRTAMCPSTSTNNSSCEDASKDFDTSRDGFSAACSALGLPSGGPEGSIACSHSKERCNCLNSGFEDSEDRYNCSDVRAERGGNTSRNRGSSSGLIDLANAKLNMKYCPQRDPDDIERYEKQLEKSQERIRELKKKLPEVMNKANEAQDKATQAQNDAHRKAVEKQKEFSNELKEIKRKKEADEQAAVAEMAQIRQQIDQVEGQVRSLEMNKLDAEVKLGETKTQVELQCHAMASQQVAALQAKKMDGIRKGMPVSDFNGLLKNVGVSSRDAWENVANVHYRRCLNSRPTRESKASAQKIYEATLRQIDSQILTARQTRSRLEESLGQIMNNKGCGQPAAQPGAPPTESKLCRSLRQASEDMSNAQQQAIAEQQQIQQEAMNAQRQLAQKNQSMSMEYQDAQRELNEEQQRMENLRAYLDLKRQFNLGSGTKESAKELATNSTKLRSSAIRINQCCVEGTITARDRCKVAEEFIRSFGGSPAVANATTDPVAAPGAPSPRSAPERSDRLEATPSHSPGLREDPAPTFD